MKFFLLPLILLSSFCFSQESDDSYYQSHLYQYCLRKTYYAEMRMKDSESKGLNDDYYYHSGILDAFKDMQEYLKR